MKGSDGWDPPPGLLPTHACLLLLSPRGLQSSSTECSKIRQKEWEGPEGVGVGKVTVRGSMPDRLDERQYRAGLS